METRGKILHVALDLFSRRGFSAVSVRDIAKEVGVRESAMYRHFDSKQAVFDQLLEDYFAQSKVFMEGIHAQPDPARAEQTAALYAQLTDDDFLRIGGSVFTDFLMQPPILKFWRMMSIERLSDDKLAMLWKAHLFDAPIAFQTGLFSWLIRMGVLKAIDPEILALEFFAPLLMLYIQALPFAADSPEFAVFMDFANRHMLHFRQIYANKGGEKSCISS